jgi:hypothetical protein
MPIDLMVSGRTMNLFHELLAAMPHRIKIIGMRDWSHVGQGIELLVLALALCTFCGENIRWRYLCGLEKYAIV